MRAFKLKLNRRMVLAIALTLFFLGCAYALKPKAKEVFSSFAAAERKLPIYCVETNEKRVAISFDAAWGAL